MELYKTIFVLLEVGGFHYHNHYFFSLLEFKKLACLLESSFAVHSLISTLNNNTVPK